MNVHIDTERFASSGYAIVSDAWGIESLWHDLDQLITRQSERGEIAAKGGSLRPRNIFQCGSVRTFLTSELMQGITRQLFDDAPILCSLGANRVLPGGQGMGIHRDYPYLARRKVNSLGPLLCLQFVLSLDGMDGSNGSTYIFPGSHAGTLSKPVRLTCAPGTLVVFHGAVMHGVDPNRCSAPRTNLLTSFSPYWVRPFSDIASGMTAQDLRDPVCRRLCGLDFAERLAASMPQQRA